MSKLHGEVESKLGRGQLRKPGDYSDQPGQRVHRLAAFIITVPMNLPVNLFTSRIVQLLEHLPFARLTVRPRVLFPHLAHLASLRLLTAVSLTSGSCCT